MHLQIHPALSRRCHCNQRRPWRSTAAWLVWTAVVVATMIVALGCRQELPPLSTVATSRTYASGAGDSTSRSADSATPDAGATESASAVAGSSTAADESLGARIDRVLEQQRTMRRLRTSDNGAWQILHGVLAYGDQLPLTIDAEGTSRPALTYLLNGGHAIGWRFAPGDVNPETGRRGLRAIVEAGSKSGQGHYDQWIAYSADCGLTLETPIVVGGRAYQLGDVVWQAQFDVPRNPIREYSWTLVGLTRYLPTDSKWVAADGQTWSIEQLMHEELAQEINGAPCGGTHRLMGMALALRNHRSQGRPVAGVWEDARGVLNQYAARARALQNADGTFSTHFFARPSASMDVTASLASTGHILEFLTLVLPPDELRQPWITSAADRVCDLLDATSDLDLECGSLYHALHALVLLRPTTG